MNGNAPIVIFYVTKMSVKKSYFKHGKFVF